MFKVTCLTRLLSMIVWLQ